MTEVKLEKIRQRIAQCRRKANTHRDLEAIVIALKRKRVKRGKEPTYESTVFPDAAAITIPDHGSKTIKKGVAANVLNDCEEDVYRFQEQIEKEKAKKDRGEPKRSIQYDESEWIN